MESYTKNGVLREFTKKELLAGKKKELKLYEYLWKVLDEDLYLTEKLGSYKTFRAFVEDRFANKIMPLRRDGAGIILDRTRIFLGLKRVADAKKLSQQSPAKKSVTKKVSPRSAK